MRRLTNPTEKNVNEGQAAASTKIFEAIVADRKYDKYGRPVKNHSRGFVREVIVRKSMMDKLNAFEENKSK